MRYDVLLSVLFVLVLSGTAVAEMGNVNFCIDMNMDDWCDEEFTSYMELDGLTDMDLLEIAFEDQLMYYNWNDYLWAVSIEGYDYDFLPQFDGAEDVVVIDGDEVYIWFTGWQWWESCTATPSSGSTTGSTQPGGPQTGGSQSGGSQTGGSQAGGSQGAGTGSGFGPGSGTGTGSAMTGTIPSGSAQVTTVSSQYNGYTVEVDGVQIGTEGTGSDPRDGSYTFYVAGNQQHTIRLTHPMFYYKNWYGYTYWTGSSYTINVDLQGDPVRTG